jgi:hypothetical protein
MKSYFAKYVAAPLILLTYSCSSPSFEYEQGNNPSDTTRYSIENPRPSDTPTARPLMNPSMREVPGSRRPLTKQEIDSITKSWSSKEPQYKKNNHK